MSDRDEKPVSPFERAVAGLVLGGENLVDRVRGLAHRIEDGRDQPSLSALRRSALPDPGQVEARVERIFAGEFPRRKKRLIRLEQPPGRKLRYEPNVKRDWNHGTKTRSTFKVAMTSAATTSLRPSA